jgi:hypothetical protein
MFGVSKMRKQDGTLKSERKKMQQKRSDLAGAMNRESNLVERKSI